MGIDSITASQAQSALGIGAARKDQLGQDAFMQLMLTQLKNQDPTKPMDPSEFLGQLAQFGTVSGIQDMQGSLSTLSDALRSTQILGGSTLVGHEVLADASQAALGATGSIRGSATIPEGVSAAGLVITDNSGQLIRRMPISAQQGDVDFEWDGTTDQGTRAPSGNYNMAVIASVGGSAEQVQTRLVSHVGSVTIDPNNYALTLNTDLGPIPLSRVRRVM